MPIVDVEIVGEVSASVSAGLASRLADGIGEMLASRPQGTWVKVHHIPSSGYAENQGSMDPEVLPIFVSIVQRALPTGEALALQTTRVANAVAEACDRKSEHVHIVYQPSAVGRVAFGGVLVQ
jgi:phenylpyruvate tautomerase PptA (4-oxalocrotonate tautomerase family)